jgi:hypothetical protein
MPRDKQIEFPPEQSPVKWLTPAMFILSIVCIVVVIIVVLAYDGGSFLGPW